MRDQYPGVVIGLVKEIDKTLGRVKLEFPWLDQSYRSAWAPIAVALSGKQRGMYFLPEVDDEALIAFEQGDFQHPYVVGFLWNGVDTPPHEDIDAKVRRLKTVSGHVIDFDDRAGQEKITIKSKSEHQIILDDTPAGQTITIKTKGQQSIVLDDKDQSIQLQGGGRILAMRSGTVQIT